MEHMQAHAWVVWAQTRFFPRYPNYKNVSVNMFNAGYPADKARRCPSRLVAICAFSGICAESQAMSCIGGTCRHQLVQKACNVLFPRTDPASNAGLGTRRAPDT